ncbi:SAUR-like auxin-responsive protein family [Euphorbia peplus]|nr:SAUR-like auxin-responsive protein family [Euphorbia peplus]
MINPKRLLQFARKWHKFAATSAKAEKGYFVVYSSDKKRFFLPLRYLNNGIVKQLFNMAGEEFGLLSDAPVTLPCDSEFIKYAIALMKQRVTTDVERLFLASVDDACSPFPIHLPSPLHQTVH